MPATNSVQNRMPDPGAREPVAGVLPDSDILLRVSNLKVYFKARQAARYRQKTSVIHAVDDVSFDVRAGETLGLVGESGCGKSTTGRAVLQLRKPTAGSVAFQGVELTERTESEMRDYRRHMQMIFQDTHSSLNPRMTIREIVGEGMTVHGLARGKQHEARIRELLNIVGLNPKFLNRYPHEFSGGQRQRIGIARALAVEPRFIVCDEPISALDVSIRAQVVNLFEDLQEQFGLTYLFIAHDLSIVRHISDRIAVMYLGKIVEVADSEILYRRPAHPYTRALLSAVPIPNPEIERKRERIMVKGEVPSPAAPPSGCRFRTRCPHAQDICGKQEPAMTEVQPGQQVACHFWAELLDEQPVQKAGR